MINGKNCEQACDYFISTFKQLVSELTKTMPHKHKNRLALPWFNDTSWHLMKKIDASLTKISEIRAGKELLDM